MVGSRSLRNVTALATLVALLAGTQTSLPTFERLSQSIAPDADAQAVSACLDRISVQDQYALVKAQEDLFFHRSIHKLDINDWMSVKDNQPWGVTPVSDIDMTEIPKGLATPTVPVGMAAQGSNVWIHYNLLDLATQDWQSLNSNKPWGNGNVTNVGIAGHSADTTLRGVLSVGDRAYFFSSVIRDNPYGSYNWGDISDNKPWGAHTIQDIDVTSENRVIVLANNISYVLHNPLALAANNWEVGHNTTSSATPFTGETRIDWDFRPAIAARASEVFYAQWPVAHSPFSTAYGWRNISDNKLWGNANVDDVTVFFWTQAEPWNTPAIVMLTAGAKPYLHWHPDAVSPTGPQNDWLDTSDNAPWTLPGGSCNPVPNESNLGIVKTGPTTPVTRGNVATYSVTVTNTGPKAATNVVVTDPVPSGLTFNAAASDASCVQQGSNVVCNLGNLALNQPKTVAISFNVTNNGDTCAETQITNTATVTGSPNDPQTANNSSSVQTTLVCQPQPANLSIVKTGPDTVTRGNPIAYTVTVANAGPSTATNVVVTDAVPSGLTFNAGASSNLCQLQGGSVICNAGSLINGESRDLQLVFNTQNVAGCVPTNVENTATVRSDQADPTTSNNQSVKTVNVQCPQLPADVSVAKTGPASVTRGNRLTYVVSVLNNGPGAAQGIVVTDAPPAALVFNPAVSDPRCSQQGSNIVCNVGVLNNGEGVNLQLAFEVPSIANCGQTSVQNRASVVTSSTDPATGNNESSVVTTSISCPSIQCSDGVDNDNDGALDFVGGDFSCSGPDDNDETNPKSQCQDGVDNDGDGKIDFGNGANNDPGCSSNQDNDESNPGSSSSASSISSASSTSSVSSASSVSSSSASSVSSSSTSSVSSAISSSISSSSSSAFSSASSAFSAPAGTANLSVAKFGQNVVQRGNLMVYLIDVHNAGPATATNVIMTDINPNGTAFHDADAPCTQQGGATVCFLGSLAPNQARRVTLVFRVNADCNETLRNRAFVLGSQPDPNINDNRSDAVETQVRCGSASSVSSSAAPSASSVASIASSSQSSSVSSSSASSISSSSVSSAFQVSSASSTPGQAVLTVAKSDGRSTANPGDVLTYTITITNAGTATAAGITVVDALPDEVAALFASDGAQINGQTVTWGGIVVGAGQTRMLTVQVQVRQNVTNGTQIRNTAIIGGFTSAVDVTTVDNPQSQTGCIEILNETFSPTGSSLPVAAAFTYALDGGRTVTNDAAGRARFDNVPVGTHAIGQILPGGWTALSTTPVNGIVQVSGGPTCVGVVFKNRQNPTVTQNSSQATTGGPLYYETPESRMCRLLLDQYGNIAFQIKKLKKKHKKSNLIKLLERCEYYGSY
jgi:uncharacterized repeat protein (TIGR01451 family)